MVSGHSLKHVAAAVAGLFVARMLWRRGLLSPTPAHWTPRARPRQRAVRSTICARVVSFAAAAATAAVCRNCCC